MFLLAAISAQVLAFASGPSVSLPLIMMSIRASCVSRSVAHDREEVTSLMTDYVGIVRSDLRLDRALRRILTIAKEVEDFYKRTKITEGLLELRNLVAVAQLIVRCARYRRESRGLHYTTDYPQSDDKWQKDTIMQSSRLSKKKMAIEEW